ncbi:MAG: tyrosine-type recombinase/integrase [Planctomycetota bacterium]|jgi:integrase
MIRVSLSKHKRKAKTGKTYTYWYLRWFSSDGTQRGHSIGRADGPNRLSRRQANLIRSRKEQELNAHPERCDVSRSPLLSKFLEMYLASRVPELGPQTLLLHKQTAKYLLAYFKDDPRIDQITKPAARSFKSALANGKLKYVSKRPKDLTACGVDLHIRNARTIFNRALEDGFVTYNPFVKLSQTIRVKKDWDYVGLRDFYQLLDACPNRGWRMLLALCRLAGLRQAEALNLTWREVDWQHNTLAVWSPKTDYGRVVPIGPELLPLLEAAFESAKEGETKIVVGLTVKNLWRDFQVIRKRAGIKPYKKWCHTLRKNREDDWNEEFPLHVVAEWMGHSPEVAHKRYLKAKDRNIEAATKTQINTELAQKLAQLGEKKGFDRVGQNRIDLLQKKI